MIQTNNDCSNDSHKKRSCRNKDVYMIYSVNGMYTAEMRETLLRNDNADNENNNRRTYL